MSGSTTLHLCSSLIGQNASDFQEQGSTIFLLKEEQQKFGGVTLLNKSIYFGNKGTK